jgi:hypothetical protein
MYFLCCSTYFCIVLCIVCVVLCIVCLCRSLHYLCVCVWTCIELLPPGGYPIAVKYIISFFHFRLTPFGWLIPWALSGRYTYHGAEQNGTLRSLRTAPITECLPFSSDLVVCLHLFKFVIVPTKVTMTRTIVGENSNTKTNNRSSNLKGSIVYDPWLIWRLCCTACENEFDYPWQNTFDSDNMKNLLSMTSLVTTNVDGTENDEQHNTTLSYLPTLHCIGATTNII